MINFTPCVSRCGGGHWIVRTTECGEPGEKRRPPASVSRSPAKSRFRRSGRRFRIRRAGIGCEADQTSPRSKTGTVQCARTPGGRARRVHSRCGAMVGEGMALVIAHDGAFAKLDVAGGPSDCGCRTGHQRRFVGVDKRAPDGLDGFREPAVSVHDKEAPPSCGSAASRAPPVPSGTGPS